MNIDDLMKSNSRLLKNLSKGLIIFFSGVFFYLFFIVLFNKSHADYDLWGYLSFGRVLWQEGFFPYQDVFSYTPTKSLWIYHEWLTGVIFFGLVKYLGPVSLQLLRYILAILTVYLIYETALKRGGSFFYILLTLIPSMVLISFGYVPVRAQIFTFFFFILTLYILEHSKKTGDVTMLRWLPLMQIFWCNLHGGFVAGLGLIFLYALGEGVARKKISLSYLQWGLIASLATCINPYGIAYWRYTVDAVFMSRPGITEWYSVTQAFMSNTLIFPVSLFLISSLIALLVFFGRKKKDITELIIIIVVVYLGIMHIRHGVFFGLVFGAYMPLYLSEYAYEDKSDRRVCRLMINVPSLIFITLLIMTYVYFYPVKKVTFVPSFRLAVAEGYYPTRAIRWMKTHHIKGNILPHFEWGEYLMWSCYPDCRVAMDGRYETVYNDHLYQAYFDFLYGRSAWKVFLEKYPHDLVLLKAGTKTHDLMLQEEKWRMVYHDHTSVIFMKKGAM